MKTKILDTNVILNHPICSIIESLASESSETVVVIPFPVLVELDRFKCGTDPINENCRMAIRFLDSLRAKGSLNKGVEYLDNIIVQVYVTKEYLTEIDPDSVDMKILLTAQEYMKYGNETEVITEDLHERIMADILGILSESSPVDKVREHCLYTGVEELDVTDKELQEWFGSPKGINQITSPKEFYPNQFVVLNGPYGDKYYGIYKQQTNKIVALNRKYTAWGIEPRKDKEGNIIMEQAMLMHLLLDSDIHFVSAVGSSGTGKTLLTLACGLQQVMADSFPAYDKIVILRPMVGVDRDLGALPGDKNQKLEPWMGAIYDNLEYLFSNFRTKSMGQPVYAKDDINWAIEENMLELEAITYLRGRSMHRQFIIVDDSQGLTPQQATTIVTRAGEGSKVVFLGDVSRMQIDNKHLTPMSNGLAYVVDRFRGKSDIIGHITLDKVVRSELASLGVKYL